MTFSKDSNFNDYQNYIWDTYILDGSGSTKDASGNTVALSGAPVGSALPNSVSTPYTPSYDGMPAIDGTIGQTMTIPRNVRSFHWFFTSKSVSGGIGYEDNVPYYVTMGGDRGDPAQEFSIVDENSVWIGEVKIEAVDGSQIYVKVQREAI